MASKAAILAVATALGLPLLGPAVAGNRPAGSAGDGAAQASASVPLPVTRPHRGGPAPVQHAQAGSTVTVDIPLPAAPVRREAGLKSDSTEALAVQLEGDRVVAAGGDVVGVVEKVIDSGGEQQAVISVGGIFGIGARHVAVPAASLAPVGRGLVRTELTEEQLERLPEHPM